MERLTVLIEPTEKKALNALARKRETNVSEIVREGIKAAIAGEKQTQLEAIYAEIDRRLSETLETVNECFERMARREKEWEAAKRGS
jgi:hypothetical protein